jgi:hypothetical protein
VVDAFVRDEEPSVRAEQHREETGLTKSADEADDSDVGEWRWHGHECAVGGSCVGFQVKLRRQQLDIGSLRLAPWLTQAQYPRA